MASILTGALVLVALFAVVTGVFQSRPVLAAGATVTVSNDFISNNDTDATVTNTVTATISDSGRNSNAAGIETISGTELTIDNLSTGVSIEATSTETGVDTGIFVVVFTVTPTTTDEDAVEIAASDGDQIRVTYCIIAADSCEAGSIVADTPDFASKIVVDATGPTIESEAPDDEDVSSDADPTLQVDIGDSGIGVGDADTDVRGRVDFIVTTTVTTVQVAGKIDAIDDDDDVQWQVQRSTASNPDGVLTWAVIAVDALGNETVAGPFSIEIDTAEPELLSATTGDVAAEDDLDVTFTDTDSNSASGIRLEFDDEIDPITVNTADFLVQLGDVELEVADAEYFDTSSTTDNTHFSIFLTLAEDLSADDEPTVQITGDIRGEAENQVEVGSTVTAADGIGPTVTVELTGTAEAVIATNASLTIRVTADEDSDNPDSETSGELVVTLMADVALATTGTGRAADVFAIASSLTVWDYTLEFDTDGTEDGVYNVYLAFVDASAQDNPGTTGLTAANFDIASDDVIIFEVDTQIADPIITFSADDTNTFITVDYTAEGTEYVSDSHATIVTLTATIDGDSVDVATEDSIVWTIAAPTGGYSEAEHDLILVATDEVGNVVTFDRLAADDDAIEIVERADLSISLRPGLNLISLPGDPVSTAINDVIGADHPINQVLTYDPAVDGGWLISERGDDGLFAGTLTTMGSSLAYFVRTTTFEALDVLIPRPSVGEQVLPPSIALVEGWNLVPVVDITGDAGAGDGIDADDYFGSITVERAYGVTAFGRLEVLDIAADEVVIGEGYWVYTDLDDVLVP
jgi:hypothetical protein